MFQSTRTAAFAFGLILAVCAIGFLARQGTAEEPKGAYKVIDLQRYDSNLKLENLFNEMAKKGWVYEETIGRSATVFRKAR